MIYTPNLLLWLETVLFERYGTDFRLQLLEDRWVMNAPALEGRIEVMRTHTSFAALSRDTPCAHWNAQGSDLQGAIANVLPAPGAATLPEPLVTEIAGGFRIGYDILALAAWMMTRQEEIGAADLDEHGRFPAVASHAFRHGYLERPIVDEWFYILSQVVKCLWPSLEMKRNEFSVSVSHDVDQPSPIGFSTYPRVLRSMLGQIVKKRSLVGAVRLPIIKLNTKNQLHASDPYNNFDWIMDASERQGLRSAFYFICGRTNAARDALYDVEHPAIRALIRHIHGRGHEVGLHPSYETYLMPGAIAHEFRTLQKVCEEEGVRQVGWGGRMHYLRWSHPTTLREWSRAGLDYDSTLGYADLPGFRCGTCHDYPAYDLERDEQLELRIRPLVVMECTITAERYMGLGKGDAAWAKILGIKNACRAVGGRFELLWHNSELLTEEDRILFVRALKD